MTSKQEYYNSIPARRNLKGRIAPTFAAVRQATRSAFSGSSRKCVEGHLTVAWNAAESLSGGEAISGEIRSLCEALIQKDQKAALLAWSKAVNGWITVLDKTWGSAVKEHGTLANWQKQQQKLLDVVSGYEKCLGYAAANLEKFGDRKDRKPAPKAAQKKKAAPKAEPSALEGFMKTLVEQGAVQVDLLVKVLEKVS